MYMSVVSGLLIPFIGTTLGAGAVFFMKRTLSVSISRALAGFAAGVMTAASVWSLILPAIEQAAPMGKLAFIPACAGFWAGIGFLLLLESMIPQISIDTEKPDGKKRRFEGTAMMVLAVTLHNIPEGMAVGAVYAGLISGSADISAGVAFALALGIAIQNLPEGSIISMPLHASGQSRGKAFVSGMLSGAVEPVFGVLTVLFAGLVVPAMPYLLSFAAGAMMYVVVKELVPETAQGERSHAGLALFAAGFSVMMALDVAFG